MSVRSPLPDLSLPDLDFSSFVLQRARQRPGKTALIDGLTGQTLTFGQLTRTVDAVAGSLLARGLRVGDVVAVCGPNTLATDTPSGHFFEEFPIGETLVSGRREARRYREPGRYRADGAGDRRHA